MRSEVALDGGYVRKKGLQTGGDLAAGNGHGVQVPAESPVTLPPSELAYLQEKGGSPESSPTRAPRADYEATTRPLRARSK